MMKFFRLCFAGIIVLLPGMALGQSAGQLPSGNVWGNSTSARAPGSPSTITSIIDRAIGSTHGSTLYRGASAWSALGPCTIGLPVLSGGAAANPACSILGTNGGGTGQSSALTQYGVVYGSTTSAMATTAAGTSSGVLQGNAAGAPTWVTTLSSTLQGNITGTGTLVSGATGAGFTLALSTSTITGTLPSANLPTATSVILGGVKPDGTIITNTAGAITVASATNATYGVMKGDGTTITCITGSCSAIGGVATSVGIGSTTISSGTTTRLLYDLGGVLQESAVLSLTAGGPLNINSTAATANQGFNVAQTGPASGSAADGVQYNHINVSSDNYNATGANNNNALLINYDFGGLNTTGARNGLQVQMVAHGSAVGDAAPYYTGIQASATGSGAAGGTSGQVVALGGFAHLTSTSSNMPTLVGAEVDVEVDTGATGVLFRAGYVAVSLAQLNGSTTDAAFLLSSGSGTAQWGNGLYFSNEAAGAPLKSTGCAICTDGSVATIATGLDLSSYTITGSFLKGPNGFSVGGNGYLFVNIGEFGSTAHKLQLSDNSTAGVITVAGAGTDFLLYSVTHGTIMYFNGTTNAVQFPTLSSGSSGYVCVDSTGLMYKNTVCP